MDGDQERTLSREGVQPARPIAVYTGVATVPGATPLPVFREHSAKYAFAARHVVDRVVLDIGCASGMGVELFGRSGARRAIGVELDPETLWFDPERYSSHDALLVQGDARSLPVADRSVDVVVMLEIIEHIEEDTRAMAEVARVMRPDGMLVFSTPNVEVSRNRNPHHVREYDLGEFRGLLEVHFNTIELYGQCYVPRSRLAATLWREAAVDIGRRAASWLGVQGVLGAARRHLSRTIPVASDRVIVLEKLDPAFTVVPHRGDERAIPAYFLAICRF